MACFATPYGLRYAAHCFNRAHAQKDGSTLIPAGGKLGVTSPGGESLFLSGNLLLATSQTRGSSASFPIFEHRQSGKGTGSRKKLKNRDRERRVMNNKAYWLASAVLMALPQVSNAQETRAEEPDRSEERRVGKECVSTCGSRGSP